MKKTMSLGTIRVLAIVACAATATLLPPAVEAAPSNGGDIWMCIDPAGHSELTDTNRTGRCRLIKLPPATAGANPDAINVIGFQDMSCGAWSRSGNNPFARDQYLSWFRGFATGFNTTQASRQVPFSAFPSSDTLSLYIDKYCRENPLNLFTAAAGHLMLELQNTYAPLPPKHAK